MANKITYHRTITTYGQPIHMINDLGKETVFSDYLVWSAFLEGAHRMRSNGVDITVWDEYGAMLVGDFSAKTPVVEHGPEMDQSTKDFQAFWARHPEFSSFGAAQEAWLTLEGM